MPGLSAAADVLLAILEHIKVRVCPQIVGGTKGLRSTKLVKTMRVNQETVVAISKDIESLSVIIDNVIRQVSRRGAKLHLKSDERSKMCHDLGASSAWWGRVFGLQT